MIHNNRLQHNILQLQFTKEWKISNNLYIIKICPKGGGKTPAVGVFLDPLGEIEREEKDDYDKEVKDRKEKKSKKVKKDDLIDKSEENPKKVRIIEDGDNSDLADASCSKFPPVSFDSNGKDKQKRNANKDYRKAKDNSDLVVSSCSKTPPASFGSYGKDGKKGKDGKDKKDRMTNKDDRKAKVEASQKIQDAMDSFDLDQSEETSQSGDTKKTSSPSEFLFHPKTRLAQTITPAALFLTLHHGNGCLLVLADEYKV